MISLAAVIRMRRPMGATSCSSRLWPRAARFAGLLFGTGLLSTCLLSTSLPAMGAALQEEDGVLVVEKPEENIRSAPNGEKIGMLFKGAEIEKIGEDGKWVRFRMEGWVWGPSLEPGMKAPAQISEVPAARAKTQGTMVTRKPRSTIQVNLSEVRELIKEDYGVFYSMDHDKDLQQLIVRFRVEKISRDVLERRQAALQAQLFDLFVDDVKIDDVKIDDLEFNSIRMETNRPDGSGQVGVEIVITAIAHLMDVDRIADVDDDHLRQWKEKSRISTDAGATWSR